MKTHDLLTLSRQYVSCSDRVFTSVTVCSMDAAVELTGTYSQRVTEVNTRVLLAPSFRTKPFKTNQHRK